MKNYRFCFKSYLGDLSKKNPSLGGGSAICLVFCLGISLIDKAINYSIGGVNKSKDFKLKKHLRQLNSLRQKVYPYIDEDGKIFAIIMQAKGKKRVKYLKKSEAMVFKVGTACLKAVSIAKGVESEVKKSIISDFHIGLEFIKTAFLGCIFNLEANQKIFGLKSKYADNFREVLEKWQ
ncbi:MAG: cyclodeaminase/cyclohydrolase family protein [Candidatus Omnitrophica bacterium]|nr:cyclodeaminase/cyclohydrolase family protein [Candidatus Omnitrophota bacterium]